MQFKQDCIPLRASVACGSFISDSAWTPSNADCKPHLVLSVVYAGAWQEVDPHRTEAAPSHRGRDPQPIFAAAARAGSHLACSLLACAAVGARLETQPLSGRAVAARRYYDEIDQSLDRSTKSVQNSRPKQGRQKGSRKVKARRKLQGIETGDT